MTLVPYRFQSPGTCIHPTVNIPVPLQHNGPILDKVDPFQGILYKLYNCINYCTIVQINYTKIFHLGGG